MPLRGKGQPSVIVSNHLGVLDILNIIVSPLFPGFTPNDGLEKLPFVGTLAASLGSFFVERGGSQEARDRIVKNITSFRSSR